MTDMAAKSVLRQEEANTEVFIGDPQITQSRQETEDRRQSIKKTQNHKTKGQKPREEVKKHSKSRHTDFDSDIVCFMLPEPELKGFLTFSVASRGLSFSGFWDEV